MIPVFVLDEETPGIRPRGGAARWWLHHSLRALDRSLGSLGSRLILRRGRAEEVIPGLARESGASAVFWNNAYDAGTRDRDGRIELALSARGVAATGLKANLLFEPPEVTSKSGGQYKVYGAFWRACRRMHAPPSPLAAPRELTPPASWPASDDLDGWSLLPTAPDWAGGLRASWAPGETAAATGLADFLDNGLEHYRQGRDLPAVKGTSRLSPHLAFGEISPRQIWCAAAARKPSPASEKFLAEIGWREFGYSLLFHSSNLAQCNQRPEFDRFPWCDGGDTLEAWQRGRTGFPIVDAGMRELWTTGWMHNRVRMVVASFLVKDLLIDWRVGERWFWDTLVDADPASNAMNWQWVAGCGADAAPYFRIFNPVLQGEKFDAAGEYVRRWVPELASLPAEKIHRPWTVTPAIAPEIYPAPIVDHAAARRRALQAFRAMKEAE